jgi:predicted enzyme related to lactoylglutathione lyase
MPGFPIWYELMSGDLAGVRDFYRATLGWNIPDDSMTMPDGSEYRVIERSDGGYAGGALTLTPDMTNSGMQPNWMPYFHAPDVDEAAGKVTRLGGQVHMPPTDIPGAGRIAMASDPQGALFYLMDPEPPEDQPDAQSDVFSESQAGHCRWNEITTTDSEGAREFYTALFGWNTDQSMPMGPLGDYRFIEADGVQIGAINPALADGARPHWGAIFGVEDIDAARAAAEAHGGSVSHDVHEIPGGEFAFYGFDPAGAKVAFVGPRKA